MPRPVAAQATGTIASSVVTVTPTRVLDTRFGTGLSGPILSNQSAKLQITGPVPTRVEGATVSQNVVPAGSTGVLLNVTALQPEAGGFVSIRPGSASGEPSASNLNFIAGQTVPNAVTTALAPDGTIDIWYGSGTSGTRTGILIDIVGFTSEVSETVGPAGPTGPAGPAGPPGVGDGFVSSASTGSIAFTGPPGAPTIDSVSLPAGNYIVNANVVARSTSAATSSVGCQLLLGGSSVATALALTLGPVGGGAETKSISLTGGGTLLAPGDASLNCATTGTDGSWNDFSVTVVQVGSITES